MISLLRRLFRRKAHTHETFPKATPEEVVLYELRQYPTMVLPRGAILEIARKTGISRVTVSRFAKQHGYTPAKTRVA